MKKEIEYLGGFGKVLVRGEIHGEEIVFGSWEGFEGDKFFYLNWGGKEILSQSGGSLLKKLGVNSMSLERAYYFAQGAIETKLHPMEQAKEILSYVDKQIRKWEDEAEEKRKHEQKCRVEEKIRGKELAIRLKKDLSPEDFALLEWYMWYNGWM